MSDAYWRYNDGRQQQPAASSLVAKRPRTDYGYKFDESDRDFAVLRLQFARYPGARSGGGHRGKR